MTRLSVSRVLSELKMQPC